MSTVPLITDEEPQEVISKSSGHSSYEDLIEQGFLSDAVVNFVASTRLESGR